MMNILLVLRNQEKKYVLSLYCDGPTVSYLLLSQKYINLKQKILSKGYTLCLSIASISIMKKTWFKLALRFFFVDYNTIYTSHNLDIHRC